MAKRLSESELDLITRQARQGQGARLPVWMWLLLTAGGLSLFVLGAFL